MPRLPEPASDLFLKIQSGWRRIFRQGMRHRSQMRSQTGGGHLPQFRHGFQQMQAGFQKPGHDIERSIIPAAAFIHRVALLPIIGAIAENHVVVSGGEQFAFFIVQIFFQFLFVSRRGRFFFGAGFQADGFG